MKQTKKLTKKEALNKIFELIYAYQDSGKGTITIEECCQIIGVKPEVLFSKS